jgi:hypothetical protein
VFSVSTDGFQQHYVSMKFQKMLLTCCEWADVDFSVRKRLVPFEERLLAITDRLGSNTPERDNPDGLLTPPPYMTDPELRKIAIELAELALQR